MSWASGGSSASSFPAAAGRRRGTEVRSPVPYRENAMAYEPAKLCHCNPRKKAPRWISWSHQNPGRRYYACVDAMNGAGCGYVEWHDGPLSKFLSDLLGDLRDEVWKLRGENNLAPRTEETGRDNVIQVLQDQLKEKNAELAAVKKNVVCVFVVFLFGLVAGKMFI